MSPVRDQLDTLMRSMRSNLDRVLIGVLAVTFVAVVWLFLIERAATTPQVDPPPPWQPEIKISKDSPDYRRVVNMSTRRGAMADTGYSTLLENNPYDPRSVRPIEELEEEARVLLNEAQELRRRGELDQALEKAREALRTLRTHRPSELFIETVEAEIKERDENKPGQGGSG